MEPEIQELPYNTNNVLVSGKDITELLEKFGEKGQVDAKALTVYRNAFVHKSYCTRKNENFLNGNTQCPQDCLPLQEESNERLEFLGDAVLDMAVAKYLYMRYPNENEGFLTKLRTKIVNGNMLADLALELGLNKFVLISKQIEQGHGRTNKKILEDCFEAFLGAMEINTSTEQTARWIVNMLEDTIDFAELLVNNNNHKDTVLKYYQHNYNYLPRFFEMSADLTANGGKIYRVCLKDKDGKTLGVGTGPNKKQAENNCAKAALDYLGL